MAKERHIFGFGFDPAESPAHFVVVIDLSPDGPVVIEERFAWGEQSGEAIVRPPVLKVVLDGYRWSRIADTARGQFNRRLKDIGAKTGQWKEGENQLVAHLGKELTLLAWAVEDADPTLIPNIVANWSGLAPEERWWLYTTINASAGHPEHGRDRGWRKAIRIAFAENPAGVAPSALLELGQAGVNLPLPADMPPPTPKQRPTATTAAASPPDPEDEPRPAGHEQVVPGYQHPPDDEKSERSGNLTRITESQFAVRKRRSKSRAQIPLLPEDER
jgi:hypothetical protein